MCRKFASELLCGAQMCQGALFPRVVHSKCVTAHIFMSTFTWMFCETVASCDPFKHPVNFSTSRKSTIIWAMCYFFSFEIFAFSHQFNNFFAKVLSLISRYPSFQIYQTFPCGYRQYDLTLLSTLLSMLTHVITSQLLNLRLTLVSGRVQHIFKIFSAFHYHNGMF